MERLSGVQPDLLPLVDVERLGADHQGVQRDEVPATTRQRRRVRLGGDHDDVGTHPSVVGQHLAGAISTTEVRSCSTTPQRRTADATPWTSRIGCSAAQWGV